MSRRLLLFFIMSISLLIFTGGVIAQSDVFDAVDTVTLAVEELEKGKWVIIVSLMNDEELAAIDIPVRYTAGIAKVKLDSMTYSKGRIDFFAYKFETKDSLNQVVRFGGLAYLNPKNPPLEPGSGEIGRAYVSVHGDREPGPFGVDTITVPPNASLMLVHKNARNIIPHLKISTPGSKKDSKDPKAKQEN